MAPYNDLQLRAYFRRIHLEKEDLLLDDRLACLTRLQQHQLVYVPFESLSLHYSQDRQISIDPQHLYDKIVVRERGGYCLENNTFFAAVLRSLGFEVVSVVCRISAATRGVFDGSWRPMSHLANTVLLDGQKYLVDVGYGADEPCRPLPLTSGASIEGLPGQQLKLEHRCLTQHSEQSQRVWVYSHRKPGTGWKDAYHFPETEMFPADFTVLKHYNMALSPFAKTVVAIRFHDEMGDNGQRLLIGTYQLTGTRIEYWSEDDQFGLPPLESEEARIAALKKYFRIRISDDECTAIRGRPSEILPLSNVRVKSATAYNDTPFFPTMENPRRHNPPGYTVPQRCEPYR